MKIAPPKLQGLQPQSNQRNFTYNTQIYKIRPPQTKNGICIEGILTVLQLRLGL